MERNKVRSIKYRSENFKWAEQAISYIFSRQKKILIQIHYSQLSIKEIQCSNSANHMLNLIEAKNRVWTKNQHAKTPAVGTQSTLQKKTSPATPKSARFYLIQITQPNKIKYISGQQQLIKFSSQFTQFQVNPKPQTQKLSHNEKQL